MNKPAEEIIREVRMSIKSAARTAPTLDHSASSTFHPGFASSSGHPCQKVRDDLIRESRPVSLARTAFRHAAGVGNLSSPLNFGN
jgi:hypothetical protein